MVFKSILKWLSYYYTFLLGVVIALLLTSCGVTKLTDKQLFHRNKIQYEIDKNWNNYVHKNDSLWIEYYRQK